MTTPGHNACHGCAIPVGPNPANCCVAPVSKCCNAAPNCCCTPLGGILNIDQGYFQNVGAKKIVDIPSLDLAYLTNCENSNDVDATILLNPTFLEWCDFYLLFFRKPAGSFYINPSNATVSAIAFNDQTYETTQNKKVPFTLYDQVIKAWGKKNNKPESNIPITARIQLERQAFLTKSLASISCYQLGLSVDEVISTLLTKRQIEPAPSPDTKATVKFTVSYRDYYCPLDISVLVIFTFITNIPCYKNIQDCSVCPSYSSDTRPARTVFDDDASIASYDMNDNGNNNKSLFSGNGSEFYLDDSSLQGGDMHSEIQKIVDGGASIGPNSVAWN
jgi:hypothetical protein